MLKNTKTVKIFFGIILLLFLFGITKLFILRFKTGDVYPVYSSLRTDPLGTRIFYESLNAIKGISAHRNYKSASKLLDQKKETIFYCGLSSDSLRHIDINDLYKLENIVASGNRLVILLYPEDKKQYTSINKNNKEENKSKYISLMDRWGFTLAYNEAPHGKEHGQEKKGFLVTSKYSLPESLSWHSELCFSNIDNKWEKVYAVNENPVVIERSFGKGTIVLSSDTYFLSNEAMHKERHPDLLVWLIGNNNKVIFDEYHFGIRENPGIASLIRKYHLQGFIIAVVFLGALFVWKNLVNLVPMHTENLSVEEDLSKGKDYIAGFVSLLRRNITTRDILTTCFKEWKRSFSHRAKDISNELKQIQSIIESDKGLPSKQQNPLQAYQQISKILSERKLK